MSSLTFKRIGKNEILGQKFLIIYINVFIFMPTQLKNTIFYFLRDSGVIMSPWIAK